MSKFGDLIDVEVPVLFDFFSEWDDVSNAMHDVLRDVAAALGGKAKVMKIDVDKHQALSEALRSKDFPTFIIYKSSQRSSCTPCLTALKMSIKILTPF